MALPYGWVKKVDDKGASYYEYTQTGQIKRVAPAYGFREDIAGGIIESAFRGYRGKKAFAKMMQDETPLQVCIQIFMYGHLYNQYCLSSRVYYVYIECIFSP